MALLTIGDQFPAYNLTAVIGGDLSKVDAQQPDDYFTTVTSDDYAGTWRIVFFQWRAQHEELKTLPFPMLSDLKRELAEATGVLNADGVADRATFIVDPNNEIQFVSVTAGSVGRNVDEVLRVLDALQSDELCACNWKKGDPTINAGELLTASV